MNNELDELPCGFLSLDQDGRIRAINERLLAWLGHESKAVQDKHVDKILTASSRLFYQMYLFPMLKAQGEVEEIYVSLLSSDQNEVPVLINGRSRDLGGAQEGGGLVNDCIVIRMTTRHKLEHELLTAKKEAEEATFLKSEAIARLQAAKAELQELNTSLQALAITDGLTGLRNRRSFQETLEATIAQFGRLTEPLSLLLIDIDHFKAVNDQCGHTAGDLVLKKIARVLKTSFRATDTVARFGGEEFAVILPGIDAEEATALGNKLRVKVASAPVAEKPVTVSIGVSTLAPDDSFSSLLNRADAALYRSKEKGRNRVTNALDVAL